MTLENSIGGTRPKNTPELDTAQHDNSFSGIPTTEAELKARKIKNENLPIQLQSEAFG